MVKPKPKPLCIYYYGGRGICEKGESCDFSHDECLPRRRENEAGNTDLMERILSSVGGDADAYRAFKSTISDYLRRRITVHSFLILAEAAQLSHLLPAVANSFKSKHPHSFFELALAIERSEEEKQKERFKQEKKPNEEGDCNCCKNGDTTSTTITKPTEEGDCNCSKNVDTTSKKTTKPTGGDCNCSKKGDTTSEKTTKPTEDEDGKEEEDGHTRMLKNKEKSRRQTFELRKRFSRWPGY